MKIFLNPGHSCNEGDDHGACYFGLRECDLTADIGKKVEDYLTRAGLETKLFQADDLAEIVDACNCWNADLFVSIHCNASDNPSARGTETYCFYGSTTGKRLAECIHNQIITSVLVESRGVKEAGFYVLQHTKCPAVLVETAFLSYVPDASILFNRPDEFARAIARGVTDFLLTNPLPDVIAG